MLFAARQLTEKVKQANAQGTVPGFTDLDRVKGLELCMEAWRARKV